MDNELAGVNYTTKLKKKYYRTIYSLFLKLKGLVDVKKLKIKNFNSNFIKDILF